MPRTGAAAATRAKTLNRDQRRRRGRCAGGTAVDAWPRAAEKPRTDRQRTSGARRATLLTLNRGMSARKSSGKRAV